MRDRWVAGLRHPTLGWAVLIVLIFGVSASSLAIWAREQPRVAVGQVVRETRTVRVTFKREDTQATEQARERARQESPPVLEADGAFFDELEASLAQLPRTVANVQSPEAIEQTIRDRFGIGEVALGALRAEVDEGQPSASHVEHVREFVGLLRRTPVLPEQEYQLVTQALSPRVELRFETGASVMVPRNAVLNSDEREKVRAMVEAAAREAGFDGALRSVAVNGTLSPGRATFRRDLAATTELANRAAEAVSPVITEWPAGTVIVRRGDQITGSQLDLYRAEFDAFKHSAEQWWRPWVRRLSIAAGVGALTLALAGYAGLFCPRVARNASRMGWLAGVLLLGLVIGVGGTVAAPRAAAMVGIAPTLLVTALLVIAYDRRAGMGFGALHALLVGLSLDLPLGGFAAMLTAIGVAVWRLDDLRRRDALVRMGAWTGAAAAIAVAGVALVDRPITVESLRQTGLDALLAGVAGLTVGALTLFLLPLIERAFDITTGMTLLEYRDPKHPLLRELQQRAPGTYNHSLNVASIAEAAADAIGADALLTYVGSLYHDIGKMNKPEYFVENQHGGINKHDKLSPAMSLLVIVGHVKDGLEIAREYNLPRAIDHFIEAHHGTTLVEYFYHRARQKAEQEVERTGDRQPEPAEIEYRYPGPRPRLKEVAIVMLTDAVESATRSMPEPTPSRIDQLVRSLANKRLLDRQFNESDLTLRELDTIVESISKSVTAIYHGRIRYPGGDKKEPAAEEGRPATKRAVDGG